LAFYTYVILSDKVTILTSIVSDFPNIHTDLFNAQQNKQNMMSVYKKDGNSKRWNREKPNACRSVSKVGF